MYYLKSHEYRITFSANGHALMSLIVSYLVVSKVNLSVDRYMSARTYAGQSLTTLRQLNQLVLTFTEGQGAIEARIWRREVSLHARRLAKRPFTVVQSHLTCLFLYIG